MKARRKLQAVARRLSASWAVPPRGRRALLRIGGCTIGNALILDGVIVFGADLQVSDGAFLNQGTFVDAHALVTIGAGASIAMNCRIITSSHEIGRSEKRAGMPVSSPVSIGDGAWLGAGVTVLPGVAIGRGAVIGAGSLVTRDVPPNALAVGSPARVIRYLEN